MLVNKFNDALRRIYKDRLPEKIAIALSGGIDSMCLASLLQNHVKQNSPTTEIYPITINHNLRNTSSLEIPLIRQNLKSSQISTLNYISKSININFKNKTSFEEDARVARYKALKEICESHDISDIFLAHHLDDQLETFSMRLLGNSGIFGLAAMNEKSKSVDNITPLRLNLIRPMLEIKKTEIYRYCLDNNVQWVQDYTNFEEINQRNVIRKYMNEHQNVKAEMEEQFFRVRKVAKYIEDQVNRVFWDLQKSGKIFHDEQKYRIDLTREHFNINSELVIARLLFKVFYPLSPSKNYHYSFHKVLETIPKLQKDTTFSLFQLQWSATHHEGTCRIEVRRQNLKEPVIHAFSLAPKSQTEWFQFDNRFWFKISNRTSRRRDYSVRTLMSDDKKNFVELPQDFKFTNYANLPVLIDNEIGKIISIPTRDANNVDIQWCLKENIYTFE